MKNIKLVVFALIASLSIAATSLAQEGSGETQTPPGATPNTVCTRNSPPFANTLVEDCPGYCGQERQNTGSSCQTSTSGYCTATTYSVPLQKRTGVCKLDDTGAYYCDLVGAAWYDAFNVVTPSCN